MQKDKLKRGQFGEQVAKAYLKKKGYKIIEENYKTKYGEIDLICRQGKQLIFVEVRSKRGENFGSPEESLDKRKLRKVWLNSQNYINYKKWPGAWRIDGVCLVLDYRDKLLRISHYQNIV